MRRLLLSFLFTSALGFFFTSSRISAGSPIMHSSVRKDPVAVDAILPRSLTQTLEDLVNSIKPVDSFVSKIDGAEFKGKSVDETLMQAVWLNVKLERAEEKDRAWDFSSSIDFMPGHLLCLHRWKIWWAIPRLLPTNESATPPETYLLLGQLQHRRGEGIELRVDEDEGRYLLFMPIVDQAMGFSLEGSLSKARTNSSVTGYYLSINGHDNSGPGARRRAVNAEMPSQFDVTETSRRAMLISSGTDPLLLVEQSMRLVKQFMRNSLKQLTQEPDEPDSSLSRREEHDCTTSAIETSSKMVELGRFHWPRGPGPSFVDHFGWCTWDSFYTDLSHNRVLGGLDSFLDTGVIPRFLILDDGWQGTNVDDRANGKQWGGRLSSFKANFKFGEGYSGAAPDLDSSSKLAQHHTDSEQGRNETERRQRLLEALAAAHEKGVLPGSLAEGVDRNSRHSLSTLSHAAKTHHRVEHLLVWHTLSGYWAGVAPADARDGGTDDGGEGSSSELDAYGPSLAFPTIPDAVHRMSVADALHTEPFTVDGVGLVDVDKARSFFADYHAELRAMGVDGVKVDAQSVVPLLRDHRGGGWDLTESFHTALQSSVGISFGSSLSSASSCVDGHVTEYPLIHCMCHSQSTLLSIAALYHEVDDEVPVDLRDSSDSGRRRSKEAALARRMPVVRGSDDFWPQQPASHGPHIYANAMNALLMSQLGLHDWDMFQSSLGKPSMLHAAARAISGGPVYVSDRPGEHDALVLRKLAFSDGSVPRPIRNARPVARRLFADPQREAGEALLLQTANPALGMAIGAFSICGAVLENDKEAFRFTRPGEMHWKHDGWRKQVDEWVTANEGVADDRTAVYEDPQWARHLRIETTVEVADVEEARALLRRNRDAEGNGNEGGENNLHHPPLFGWIAHRLSDGALFYVDGERGRGVPVVLPHVFDFDVVSFARILAMTQRVGHSDRDVDSVDSKALWVAVVGAVDMLNPGGAVLSVSIAPNSNGDDCQSSSGASGVCDGGVHGRAGSQDSPSVKVSMDLLGGGRYWLVFGSGVMHFAGPEGLKLDLETLPSSGDRADDQQGVISFDVQVLQAVPLPLSSTPASSTPSSTSTTPSVSVATSTNALHPSSLRQDIEITTAQEASGSKGASSLGTVWVVELTVTHPELAAGEAVGIHRGVHVELLVSI